MRSASPATPSRNSNIGVAIRANSDITGQHITVTCTTPSATTLSTTTTTRARQERSMRRTTGTAATAPSSAGPLREYRPTSSARTPHADRSLRPRAPSSCAQRTLPQTSRRQGTAGSSYNDNTDALDDTLGSFVTGPGTAPVGIGSAQISTPLGTRQRRLQDRRT